MENTMTFITATSTPRERECARISIESLRAFGGPLSGSPVWWFESEPQQESEDRLEHLGVQAIPLAIPTSIKDYPLSEKVYACAQAEELMVGDVQALVWLTPETLVIQPPGLFELGQAWDVAVRPVHIRNVGLLATDPVDDFWKGVYQAAGVNDIGMTVESFVDAQSIRAYFNTHIFAVNPAKGLLRGWREGFERLVSDEAFQRGACADELHQIFLHQALLSAVLATQLEAGRILILPPTYSYPYNLQRRIPAERRCHALNNLVCVVYEERPIDPEVVEDVEIHEPLRSWLSARARASGSF